MRELQPLRPAPVELALMIVVMGAMGAVAVAAVVAVVLVVGVLGLPITAAAAVPPKLL